MSRALSRGRRVAGSVVLVLLAGCGGGGNEATPRAEARTTSVEPSEPGVFTSPEYGYSLRLPEGWSGYPAKESLYRGQFPHPGSPEVDTFNGPDGENLTVAAQPGSGLTQREWTDETIVYARDELCEPASTENTQLDGESASLVVYETCTGHFVLWLAVLHEDSAYHLIWSNAPGTEVADRKELEKILSSFAFAA